MSIEKALEVALRKLWEREHGQGEEYVPPSSDVLPDLLEVLAGFGAVVLRAFAESPTPEMLEEAWLELQAGHEVGVAVSEAMTKLAEQLEARANG